MRERRCTHMRWIQRGSVVPMMLLAIACKDEAPEQAERDPVVGKAAEDPGAERRMGAPTQQQQPQPATEQTPTAGEGEDQPKPRTRPTDDQIASAVQRELRDDKAVPEGIDVKSRYGIVTLTGTVSDLLAEQRALRVAETIRGVTVVVDDIEVKATQVDDETLRKDVQQALLDDPAADRWQIDVKVKDGSVTLAGTLESWTETNHAERVAMSVRGVQEVSNDLEVRTLAERPDPEVQRDVQERLRWDALLEHGLVDVRVNDGTVELIGTVGSAAERRRARASAWVAGTKQVDVSGLQVQAWADEPLVRDPALPAPTDEQIAAAIELAMIYDPAVLSYEIDPQVSGGVVTLTGKVDNPRTRDAAERIASSTIGATRVDNRITIEPAEAIDDQALAARIDQALLRNAVTASYEIDVAVDDGRVTLTGAVDDYAEFGEASDVASGFAGVRSVSNQLTVADPTPFIYDPYLVPFHPYGGTGVWHGALTTTATDEEIAEEIRDEMFWSPFVDADEVQVSVSEGKATLTGTVDSWMEHRSATENAYEGGAVSVDNQLQVNTAFG